MVGVVPVQIHRSAAFLRYCRVMLCSALPPGEDEEETVAAVDPYDLLEPVEILSKMPKDFYDKIVGLPEQTNH